jgi:hypothetical protein
MGGNNNVSNNLIQDLELTPKNSHQMGETFKHNNLGIKIKTLMPL